MNAPYPFLTHLIQELRTYSQQDVQMTWHGLHEDAGGSLRAAMAQGDQWEKMSLNERQHIAWQQGQVLWLYQRFVVPEMLHGYPLQGLTLRLSTAWWAEDAQLYINGELVQEGDLFDFFTRLCLSEAVMPGQLFDVTLRLMSPKHDAGALVRSHLLYEAPNHPLSPEPGFVADELQVLQYYLKHLAPEKLPAVESLITQEWQANHGSLHQRLASLRQCLLPYGDWVKQRQIHCVGHAHLDLAWLWPVADTWRAAERTFESVLALQQDFPELTYSHSSPALFDWLEANRPELFRQIQQQVANGQWSIDAGLWVEPELNIVSGEAIARQILYGQRYCQEKFGTRSLIAWLPDTFGFCSQLPQLLKLGGIEVFATQKLRWNDTTQFPHELFCWRAPDGSEVIGWTLPPIGTDFDPLQIADYAAAWEATTKKPHTCWLPGVGDHGGGPTRDMLLKARRWGDSPFFPQITFSTPGQFLQAATGKPQSEGPKQLEADGGMSLSTEQILDDLPVWDNELYLELHRGCYTVHSDQKQQNRRGEDLLYQAELWSTVAQLVAKQPYPKDALEAAWKALLFNQFHDILPGSSIPEVFKDANQQWEKVHTIGQETLTTALEALANCVAVKADHKPLLVFNAHSWSRTDVVNVSIPPGDWQILDCETNQPVDSMVNGVVDPFNEEINANSLSFVANGVPAVGYRLYALLEKTSTNREQIDITSITDFVLENDCLRAVVSAETGEIVSCIHCETGQEIFSSAANQLQCFEDSGQYWDAWNIDPDYAEKPCAPAQLTEIKWISHTSISQRLRVTRQLNKSTIVQDYRLEGQSPLLKVETWIDWQETQVVLKVNFPLMLSAEHATYEVPFGAIERPTNPVTEHDKAKWEVPALRWADLSNDAFGVSILADCKHGFDAQPNQLRLTLLKAPLWPDPGCDRGHHHFTYAVYPHQSNWQAARTPHYAQELNIPLRAHIPEFIRTAAKPADVSSSRSFLSLDSEHLILSAFKPSESDSNQFIARYYDAYGQSPGGANSPLNNSLGLLPGDPLNLLEDPIEHCPDRPYQIQTHSLYSQETGEL
ncbi:MAG: alpha-mannosidase [Cyanobacteria bacterium P01_H01_bin.21]